MKITDHGCGVVEFENVINIDKTFLKEYINYISLINESTFTYIEEDGKKYALNKTGFKFEVQDIPEAPSRYTKLYEDNADKKYILFIDQINQGLYQCLVEYCKLYPDAHTTIWWKIDGHIAGYDFGQWIGPHCDNQIPFTFGETPNNEFPIHNTVSCGLYLNDCVDLDSVDEFTYSGGEMNFPHAKVTYKPKSGGVIMYPSNYIGRHEVKPVTKGNRYVFLQFYSYGVPKNSSLESFQMLENLKKDAQASHVIQRQSDV
jgi:hypothetical protein